MLFKAGDSLLEGFYDIGTDISGPLLIDRLGHFAERGKLLRSRIGHCHPLGFEELDAISQAYTAHVVHLPVHGIDGGLLDLLLDIWIEALPNVLVNGQDKGVVGIVPVGEVLLDFVYLVRDYDPDNGVLLPVDNACCSEVNTSPQFMAMAFAPRALMISMYIGVTTLILRPFMSSG